MNALTQDVTLLIGSRGDIEKLENAESAKALVVSDSHGSWHNLYAAILEAGSECDALIFCGDGLSDVAEIISQSQTDNALSKYLPSVIACVQGNNDTDMYPVRNKNYKEGTDIPYYSQIKIPLVQSVRIAGFDIFISHGHKYSLYRGTDTLVSIAQNSLSNIALYGHTHVAAAEIKENNILVLNPGSCARPRMGQPNTFAVLDFKKRSSIPDYTFYSLTAKGAAPYIPDGRMLTWGF